MDVSLEVEMGCGRGKFLIERAKTNPHIHFLGIDIAAKWLEKGARKQESLRLNNLFFVEGWAPEIIQSFLSPASIDVLHIYFPDPWPKRRHGQRRLFQEENIQLFHQYLKPGGCIEVATDTHDYFLKIKSCIQKTNLNWSDVRESVNERLFASEIQTDYELKYKKEGRSIFYLELKKIRGVIHS